MLQNRIVETNGQFSSERHHGLSGQPFPNRGVLANSMDTPLAVLRRTIPNALQQSPVYAYILTSVKVRQGQFVQDGSGPNFQGGYISLCTCKHKDRASAPPRDCRGIANPDDPWEGVWVAGLCSLKEARTARSVLSDVGWANLCKPCSLLARPFPPVSKVSSSEQISVTSMNPFRALKTRRGQRRATCLICRSIVMARPAARRTSRSATTGGIRDCWLAILS